MIVNFIGSPRSGKTTTASRVFSNLKEAGFNCEYIPEQARFYIASKRNDLKLKPSDTLKLTDNDQLVIMEKQFNTQNIMLKACGSDSIVITDSSPLNSLLYMSPNVQQFKQVQDLIKEIDKQNNVYFYCEPVKWIGGMDPNRVHTEKESLEIDKSIVNIIVPLLKQHPTCLNGDIDTRWKTATNEIFRKILNGN